MDAGCILASNTSSLSITTLGAGTKHPDRIVGMHFFNPAPLMPLVEVVSGLATSAAVAETIYATAEAWGKSPVYAASTPGFIVNRCARPFYAEGLRLLAERAADAATLDAVHARSGRLPHGPVRADRSHRPRRESRGDEERLGRVSSTIRAMRRRPPGGARRGGFPRPQGGTRLLRLRAGRGEGAARAPRRSSRRPHA